MNATRSTPGWAVRAAPASSPMPCTHVECAVGKPGVARDLREHRRGERRPLGRLQDHRVARRERGRHAPGRQHQRRVPGRDHDRDPARIPGHVLGEARRSPSTPVSSASSWSAKNRKLRATRGITEFRIERSSDPLSRVSTAASSGTRASTPSATRWSDLGAFLGGHRAPGRRWPSRAAATAWSASSAPPRATSAIGCSSIGETSSNVVGGRDALATDPVVGRDLDAFDDGFARRAPLPRQRNVRKGRSHPNGMGGREALSSREAHDCGQVPQPRRRLLKGHLGKDRAVASGWRRRILEGWLSTERGLMLTPSRPMQIEPRNPYARIQPPS